MSSDSWAVSGNVWGRQTKTKPLPKIMDLINLKSSNRCTILYDCETKMNVKVMGNIVNIPGDIVLFGQLKCTDGAIIAVELES